MPAGVLRLEHKKILTPVTFKTLLSCVVTEKGYCMRGDMCSFDHGSDPLVLEGISGMLEYPPPPVPPGPPGTPGYTPAPAPTQGVPRPRPPPPRHPHFGKLQSLHAGKVEQIYANKSQLIYTMIL